MKGICFLESIPSAKKDIARAVAYKGCSLEFVSKKFQHLSGKDTIEVTQFIKNLKKNLIKEL